MAGVREELAARLAKGMDCVAIAVDFDRVVAAAVFAGEVGGGALSLEGVVAREPNVRAAALEDELEAAGRALGGEVTAVRGRDVGGDPEIRA